MPMTPSLEVVCEAGGLCMPRTDVCFSVCANKFVPVGNRDTMVQRRWALGAETSLTFWCL